jgi:hypothetical protein
MPNLYCRPTGFKDPLPLIEMIDHRRWDAVPLAAKMIRRRYGVVSASTATAIAQLAGFRGGDR